jgi:hypothetical protein
VTIRKDERIVIAIQLAFDEGSMIATIAALQTRQSNRDESSFFPRMINDKPR